VPRTHRVGQAGKPRRRLMRRRGSGATHSRLPGDGGAPLPGTTTRRQELADERGWSTFRKRGPTSSQHAAVERRKARSYRFATEERDHRKTSHGPVAHRGPRKPQRLPALRSPRGGLRNRRAKRARPGPTKKYGRRSVGLPAEARSAKAGCLTIESVRRERPPSAKVSLRSSPPVPGCRNRRHISAPSSAAA
jgi:hypothetical protein